MKTKRMGRHLVFFRSLFVMLFSIFLLAQSFAQNYPIEQQRYVYFPHPMHNKWSTSLGISATTLPYDITEELHYRIPAGDVHFLTKINKNIQLDSRFYIQILQNLVTVGPRWTTRLNDRFCMAIGDDMGYWFGFVNFAGFKSRGNGLQNSPNISFGYRFNKQVLLTLKADAILNFDVNTYAGNSKVTSDYKVFSGTSYMLVTELPFYGKRGISLGFRAMYTNFFWQTWAAFESFDRNIFYPQIVIAVIL